MTSSPEPVLPAGLPPDARLEVLAGDDLYELVDGEWRLVEIDPDEADPENQGG